jgi:hypothetical protein
MGVKGWVGGHDVFEHRPHQGNRDGWLTVPVYSNYRVVTQPLASTWKQSIHGEGRHLVQSCIICNLPIHSLFNSHIQLLQHRTMHLQMTAVLKTSNLWFISIWKLHDSGVLNSVKVLFSNFATVSID